MEWGPIFRSMKQNKIAVVLLVLEMAFTLAITVNCLTMIQDARRIIQLDTGVDHEQLITVQLSTYGANYQERAFRESLMKQDFEAIRRIPGVENVCYSFPFPLRGGGTSTGFHPAGTPPEQSKPSPVYYASYEYAQTLGLDLLEVPSGAYFSIHLLRLPIDTPNSRAVLDTPISRHLATASSLNSVL